MELALIGKGGGKNDAPLKGKGAVTWGVNDIVGERECDVCFWLDRHLMKGSQMDETITVSINHTHTPMYSAQLWDDIPTSVVYPKQEIFDAFGIDYFADSCSYMLALAIYQGFTEFSLYGFNYSWGGKYLNEKPCVEFWLGIALARGLTVNLYGKNCSLLSTVDGNTYSYQEPQEMNRENLRLPKFDYPNGEVEFTISDRVKLIGMLPKEGKYDSVRFSKELRRSIMFGDEEAGKLNFRYLNNQNTNQPTLIWDKCEVPNKKMQLSSAQRAMVSAWVAAANDRGEMDYHSLGLYEKFCLGETT